jgi:hypothetical protein
LEEEVKLKEKEGSDRRKITEMKGEREDENYDYNDDEEEINVIKWKAEQITSVYYFPLYVTLILKILQMCL